MKNLVLKYNVPVEVSKKQYDAVIVRCAGIIAHKIENSKYYIKLWIPKYRNEVLEILNQNI